MNVVARSSLMVLGLLLSMSAGAAAQKAFKADKMYVVDGTGALLEYDEAGEFVKVLDDDSAALAFGPDGLLWVASDAGVRGLDADGDVIVGPFGGVAIDGTPTGMCFAADGTLCVAVNGPADVIAVFDVAPGLLIRSLALSAALDSPLSLAPDGHVVGTFSAMATGGAALLQLVECDTVGGQLTSIDLGDVAQVISGAVTFGPDGNQYFTTPLEDRITVRSPAGLSVAFIGTGAGLDGLTDLRFGPDGNLYVGSFDSDSIAVIDTTGNLVRTLGADSPLDGPRQIAFAPRRFKTKLTGKLVDAVGKSSSLKADAIATLFVGDGQLMLVIEDDPGDGKDFGSLFGTTLVFSGHRAAGVDPKTRRLQAVCVLDATLDAGFAATDLSIKGKLDKDDDRFVPSKATGSFLRAAAGRVFAGKLSTGKLISK